MTSGDRAAIRARVKEAPLQARHYVRFDLELEVYPSELVAKVKVEPGETGLSDMLGSQREAFRVADVLSEIQLPSVVGPTKWMVRMDGWRETTRPDAYVVHMVPVAPTLSLTQWSKAWVDRRVSYQEHEAMYEGAVVPNSEPAPRILKVPDGVGVPFHPHPDKGEQRTHG
jgi:hypothetical protein